MKRIKLIHGTARVDDNVSDDVVEALNELSIRAFHQQTNKMKESEKVQLEIDEYLKNGDPAENDWTLHQLNIKKMRAENMENFESKWLHRFQEKFTVDIRENESFTVHTRSHGKIDFYPKANKILFRNKNKWRHSKGLQWLVRNLLDMK